MRARWRQLLGGAAEDLAARHLVGMGCDILARRYRWRRGEIDLIVQDGPVLAFVEVKARRGQRFGTPAQAVTRRKRRHLVCTARHYLRKAGWGSCRCRFDVVCVELQEGRARIRWLRDAFRP
ncbi:MAG: YraN family protein [Acidobacteriota bacterium]